MSSKVALEEVLQFFITRNIELAADRVQGEAVHFADCSFSTCEEIATSKQQLFVCAETSVDKLTQRIQQHSCQCQRPLQRTQLQMLGHVAMVTLQCDNGHKLLWPTSSYLGTKYLANSRMAHGYFISGILPNQYLRVAEAAGIGKLSDVYLSEFFENYKECVKTLADESCVDALYEEIVAYPEMDGINILTDTRHGTRRNSKYTDVVCTGAESHKVLRIKTITRADEPCAQKHELLGTNKIYDYLENQEGGSVSVRVLCHDRNMSVQSWVRG